MDTSFGVYVVDASKDSFEERSGFVLFERAESFLDSREQVSSLALLEHEGVLRGRMNNFYESGEIGMRSQSLHYVNLSLDQGQRLYSITLDQLESEAFRSLTMNARAHLRKTTHP